MSCNEEMQVKLSRYVDSEMETEERAAVEDHLAGCEPCRRLLELFQKNENLLSNSLTTDAFGEAVIESVVNQLHNVEPPPEAKPIEEGAWDWVRTRPLVQLAAAVLLVVGLLVILSASHSGQMSGLEERLSSQKEDLEELQKLYDATRAEYEQESQRIGGAFARYEEIIREIRVQQMFERAPELHALAYIEPRGHELIVKASFDGENYTGFLVYRADASDLRKRGEKAYELLTETDPLQVPRFRDMTAKRGKTYVYRFCALGRSGTPVYAVPIKMRIPHAGNLAPEAAVRVTCEEIAAKTRDEAKFRLERKIDGRVISRVFHTKLGEPVGHPVRVRGLGEVDFSTGLVFTRIRSGNQTLAIRVTEPVLDPSGKPIVQRIDQNTVVPATRERDEVLNVRPNLRAELKPLESNGDERSVSVWRGGGILVPTPE